MKQGYKGTAKEVIKQKKENPALIAVSRKAGKAIVDFDMISDGDRIAVAVSASGSYSKKNSLNLINQTRIHSNLYCSD